MQTIIYRMDKQHVLLYSTGNQIQHHVANHNGTEYEKVCVCIYVCVCVCMCITESFCCTAEMNITL